MLPLIYPAYAGTYCIRCNIECKCLIYNYVTGNILDDEKLMNALNQVKHIVVEVTHRLDKAQVTKRDLTISRQNYLPVRVL